MGRVSARLPPTIDGAVSARLPRLPPTIERMDQCPSTASTIYDSWNGSIDRLRGGKDGNFLLSILLSPSQLADC